MNVGELISKLSEFNLDTTVLIKSLKSNDGALTLFEEIVEVKQEGLFDNYQLKNEIVITPTFDNRKYITKE